MGIILTQAVTGCLLYRKVFTCAPSGSFNYAAALPRVLYLHEVPAGFTLAFNPSAPSAPTLNRETGATAEAARVIPGGAVRSLSAGAVRRVFFTLTASNAATGLDLATSAELGGDSTQTTSTNLTVNDGVLGGQILQSHYDKSASIIDRAAPGTRVGADIRLEGAIQARGSGSIHPTSGDTFTVTYATGGANFTREARTSRRPGTTKLLSRRAAGV